MKYTYTAWDGVKFTALGFVALATPFVFVGAVLIALSSLR